MPTSTRRTRLTRGILSVLSRLPGQQAKEFCNELLIQEKNKRKYASEIHQLTNQKLALLEQGEKLRQMALQKEMEAEDEAYELKMKILEDELRREREMRKREDELLKKQEGRLGLENEWKILQEECKQQEREAQEWQTRIVKEHEEHLELERMAWEARIADFAKYSKDMEDLLDAKIQRLKDLREQTGATKLVNKVLEENSERLATS